MTGWDQDQRLRMLRRDVNWPRQTELNRTRRGWGGGGGTSNFRHNQNKVNLRISSSKCLLTIKNFLKKMYELWVKQNDVWDKIIQEQPQHKGLEMGECQMTAEEQRSTWHVPHGLGEESSYVEDSAGKKTLERQTCAPPFGYQKSSSVFVSLFLSMWVEAWGRKRHDKELCQAEKHGCSGYRQGSYEPQRP